MSNSSRPRVLKMKKLPKGIFKWKVSLRMYPGHSLSYYTRYYEEDFVLPADVISYLENNLSGKFRLNKIKGHFDERKNYEKFESIYFENQLDVTMFKLCYGHLVRRIYRIEV